MFASVFRFSESVTSEVKFDSEEGIMRLKAINCIFLACAAVALASEPRPRRHLHQIKKIISNTLFGCNEPSCKQSQPSQPEVKFFKIPGFNNVVIKAVPKGSTAELPPIYEEIPPNSHIGIIGSYLGTSNLNDTYKALQGVKNLLQSGILGTNNGALDGLTFLPPSKFQNIVTAQSIPVKPCLTPGYVSPPPPGPIPLIVRPPKVSGLLPTQYSYKQVNQDGTLTAYTSSLHINKGVKVTEEGKTLPFFIDRIRKIPVQLPVPVLPEPTKIVISNPYDNFGPYPLEPIHPGSSYSYHQVHHDGKLTTYTGLPPLNGKYDGRVFVSETGKKIPPPPVISSDPFVNYFRPNPAMTDVPVPAEKVIYNSPLFLSRLLAPEQGGYSYTQVDQDGGKTTTHSALPDFNAFTKNPAVSVTKYGVSAPALDQLPTIPKMNLLRPSAPDASAFSYKQVHANGKMTTYTESEKVEELNGAKPQVHTVSHPSIPPHISDRIEKVAAGAKFKLPPFSAMPLVNSFAVPIPSSFVNIPSVHTSRPVHPVKMPSTSFQSPFVYKYINRDDSVMNYGDGLMTTDNQPPKIPMPIPPGHLRVFESSINPGPFPINVNLNAVKPSTPVSGSYSYKLVHDGQVSNHAGVEAFDGYSTDISPQGISSDQPFPVPPAMPIPVPVQGCVDPEITPNEGPPTVLFQEPVPLSYTYKQISHSRPDSFLVVNVEDPVMDMKKVNMKLSSDNQKPNGYVFVPPSNNNIPAPPVSKQTAPQSSFSYKQATNHGLYEYSDEFGPSSVKTNEPQIVLKPQDNSAGNVYVEQTSNMPSSPQPIPSNTNSLTNNPIVVPEQIFTESSIDGSTITVNDNSPNSVAVDVEQAQRPESVQAHDSPTLEMKVHETLSPPGQVNEGSGPSVEVSEAPNPQHQQEQSNPGFTSGKPIRRRKIKRVKHRGDIPESD